VSDDANPAPASADTVASDLLPSNLIAIRKEVETVVDRQINLLKVALAIVLGALLLFGLKTFSDIKRAVTEAANKRADEEYKSVEQQLTKFVNRAIVADFLIHSRGQAYLLHQNSADRSQQARETLTPGDWNRLREWLKEDEKNDSITVNDFADVVRVLGMQDATRANEVAAEILAPMLNPATSRTTDDKRLAILKYFAGPGLEREALKVAVGEANPNELRLSAIRYIQATRFRDAMGKLLPLASIMDDDEVHEESTYACASLDPVSKEIGKIVAAITALPNLARVDRMRDKAVKLATSIWYSPVTGTADRIRMKLEEGKLQNAKKLLEFAFKEEGVYIAVLDNGTFVAFVNAKYQPYEAFSTSRDDFAQLTPYWMMLEDAANQGDVEKFSRLVPRSALQNGLCALQVDLTKNSGIVVDQARVVDTSKITRLTLIRTGESERRKDYRTLNVVWTDRAGETHKGLLAGFRGKGFSFSIPKGDMSRGCS
jgi:hypothetical protein